MNIRKTPRHTRQQQNYLKYIVRTKNPVSGNTSEIALNNIILITDV